MGTRNFDEMISHKNSNQDSVVNTYFQSSLKSDTNRQSSLKSKVHKKLDKYYKVADKFGHKKT